jgi:hypothetical protein
MADSFKGELLVYLDIGLVGTFVGLRQSDTEKGYVYVEYVPLMHHPFKMPKKTLLSKPIPEDCIFFSISRRTDIPGVEGRIVFIRTGEEGSIVNDFIDPELIRQNEELAEENRRLKMNVASARQESEDARSGVNKTIASLKSLNRQGSSVYDEFNRPPVTPFGPSVRRDYRDVNEFEEF